MDKNILEHPTFTKRKQCQRLVTVLEMTKEMVDLAAAGCWNDVASLEKKRRKDLNECFAYDIADQDSHLMAQALATVLHMNEELMSVVANTRRDLIKQHSDAKQATDGLRGYRDIGQL